MPTVPIQNTFYQSTYPHDEMLLRQFVFEVHDQSRLAIAINVKNAPTGASCAHMYFQAERAKVTHVNRAVGQCFMELFHQPFVVRTDWSQRDLCAVLHFELCIETCRQALSRFPRFLRGSLGEAHQIFLDLTLIPSPMKAEIIWPYSGKHPRLPSESEHSLSEEREVQPLN